MAFYPNDGALRIAEVISTELANCEVLLFKSGVLTESPSLTLAEIEAEECDFTGYAREVVTAPQAPGLNPNGGASIQFSVQFGTAAPYTVGNTVGGYAVVSKTTPDEVINVQFFPEPIAMEAGGQIIPITHVMLFGTPSVA